MGKLLLFVVAAIAGWFFYKGLSKRGGTSTPAAPQSRTDRAERTDASTPLPTEKMVRCARCGVFMPFSESVSKDGTVSCLHPESCAHRAGK